MQPQRQFVAAAVALREGHRFPDTGVGTFGLNSLQGGQTQATAKAPCRRLQKSKNSDAWTEIK